MKLPVDFLLYKQKLKKQASLWRNLALLAILLCVLSYVVFPSKGLSSKNFKSKLTTDYIARVTIDSEIFEDPYVERKLKDLAEDKRVKAVVLYVNSPGGSMFGGESVYNSIRNIATKKPVVTVMGTVAASGGYMASIAADYVIAGNSTITGSIGVLLISPEVSELAKKIGVNFIVLKSGKFKAEPLPFEKLDPAVREVTMSSIMDSYELFVDMVSKRRNLPRAEVYKLADGRVFTGRQALKNRLIDAIGNEDNALEYLYTEKNIDKKLDLVDFDIKKKTPTNFLFEPLNSLKYSMQKQISSLFISNKTLISG